MRQSDLVYVRHYNRRLILLIVHDIYICGRICRKRGVIIAINAHQRQKNYLIRLCKLIVDNLYRDLFFGLARIKMHNSHRAARLPEIAVYIVENGFYGCARFSIVIRQLQILCLRVKQGRSCRDSLSASLRCSGLIIRINVLRRRFLCGFFFSGCSFRRYFLCGRVRIVPVKDRAEFFHCSVIIYCEPIRNFRILLSVIGHVRLFNACRLFGSITVLICAFDCVCDLFTYYRCLVRAFLGNTFIRCFFKFRLIGRDTVCSLQFNTVRICNSIIYAVFSCKIRSFERDVDLTVISAFANDLHLELFLVFRHVIFCRRKRYFRSSA